MPQSGLSLDEAITLLQVPTGVSSCKLCLLADVIGGFLRDGVPEQQQRARKALTDLLSSDDRNTAFTAYYFLKEDWGTHGNLEAVAALQKFEGDPAYQEISARAAEHLAGVAS